MDRLNPQSYLDPLKPISRKANTNSTCTGRGYRWAPVLHKLKAFQQQEYADRHEFVNRNPLFSRWSPRFRSLLEMSLRKEQFSFDSVIVKQGEPVTGLIFIRKGQARLICDPVKHQQQYEDILHVESEVDKLLDSVKSKKKQQNNLIYDTLTKQPTKQRNLRLRRNEGYAAAERENLSRSVVICTVSEKEVIGDIEITMRLSTYVHSVVSTEETEVYILDMKNFDRLISKRNPHTVETMKFGVVSKLRSRSETKQGDLVPLLRHLLMQLTRPEVVRPGSENPDLLRKLPELKTTKGLPDLDTLNVLLIDRFMKNRGIVLQSHVPGTQYYKSLMEEKTKQRAVARQKYIERQKGRPNNRNIYPPQEVKKVPEIQSVIVNHNDLSEAPKAKVKVTPPKPEVKSVKPEVQTSDNTKTEGLGTITEDAGLETIAEDAEEIDQVFVTELPSREATMTMESKKRPRAVTFDQDVEEVEDEPNEKVRYEFNDAETSDTTLSYLEERLRNFLERQGSKSGRPHKIRHMKRFSKEDEDTMRFPKPGGRVMIKRRVCRFADSKYIVKDHNHVKYHMLKHGQENLTNFMMAKFMQKRPSVVK